MPKNIKKWLWIAGCSCLVMVTSAPSAYSFGQIDDSEPHLGEIVVGRAKKDCSLGYAHNLGNAVDVFGKRIADQLPLEAPDYSVPDQEVRALAGVASVRLSNAELSLYKAHDYDVNDSMIWITAGGRLRSYSILKNQQPVSLIQCTIAGQVVALVTTADKDSERFSMYVFGDNGRLTTTVQGHERDNIPFVSEDEDGNFILYGSGLTINELPMWPHDFPAIDDPNLTHFLKRLHASSASMVWKAALEGSLHETPYSSPHEVFFPCIFLLASDGRVVAAPSQVRQEFYLSVAKKTFRKLTEGDDEYGIFTHDLTLPIFVRVLSEVKLPGFARETWIRLPARVKAEIDLPLLVDFWQLKHAPEVGAAF